MLGKTLSGDVTISGALRAVIAAMITAALFAVPLSASDTAKTAAPVVDTSVAVKTIDTAAVTAADSAVAGGDTAAVAKAADTLSGVDTLSVSDTLSGADTLAVADTAEIDTAQALSTADTAAASAADTAASAAGITDTAIRAIGGISSIDENTAEAAGGKMIYVLFFGLSIAVIAVTIFFFTRRHDTRRFLTTTRLSVLDKMVQKGCRYIEANYADPGLTVSAVCRELTTGEAYLDTLFVKEIGIDVHDFLSQVRVNRIKNLLVEDPSADIETVYRQCGYTDKATADRHFAKLCGGVGMEVYAKSLVSAGRTPGA